MFLCEQKRLGHWVRLEVLVHQLSGELLCQLYVDTETTVELLKCPGQ